MYLQLSRGNLTCNGIPLQEEHGNPIFGVKFNELLDDEGTFATVGSNRVRDNTFTVINSYSTACRLPCIGMEKTIPLSHCKHTLIQMYPLKF